MEQSFRDVCQSDYKSISVERLDMLRKEQDKYIQGSFEWADYEAKINRIIAENYLRYVNR